MNAPTQDREAYSYDDVFPERFLHAPDLDGKTVTLTITDIWQEWIQNPKQKRKNERGDLCGILAFRGTKREYAMSKQNAWILKTLWGKKPDGIIGKRITISPVPDGSGFTEHHTRILFVGSPDIDGDRAMTLPGGQAMTFKKTVAGKQQVDEGSVDPVTGEVASTEEASPAAQEPPAAVSEPAAVTIPEDPDDASDGPVPGSAHLFDANDGGRPASSTDKKRLAEALKHVPDAVWTAHLNTEYGKERADLTHDEAVAFCAWAVNVAVAG